MTRKEHLEWCKGRALEYVDQGDLSSAVSSMVSDMQKHPETSPAINETTSMLGVGSLLMGADSVRHWIEGFN